MAHVPHEVDAVVIGMGVGGEHAAERLAEEGLDVVGVEAELAGGECPYWACIPSKMMIRAGNLLAEARRVPGMAGDSQVAASFAPVADRIREEATDGWNDQVAVDRFTGKGVHFVRGRARLAGPGRVEADGQAFSVRRAVVLATGNRPQIPPVPGLEATPYETNRQAVSVKEPPASLLVLGGGAIGVELAQAFSRFGTAVTIVEAMERLLPGEDPAVGALLAGVRGPRGRRLPAHPGGRTGDHRAAPAGGHRTPAAPGRARPGERRARPQARALAVDGQIRAADGVWGVGDVTGQGLFTHVAMYQAEIAVRASSAGPDRTRTTGRCPGSPSPTPKSAPSG
ncbi:FAD-dependent oxidoreductase [Streptomyces wuyuanensis]|uniref:FAD-dependent oxidoreductase n=1 Tax=Streptomyces wuyuanensis TaxID=1196353 RepID=UPI0037F285C7